MRKLLSLIIIGFLVILNFNLLKSSYESAEKLKQISKEEEKVENLEQTNKTLREELERRNSPYFIEQEARNRLGYSREGESVIVIEDEDITEAQANGENEKSNFEKWVELLKIQR